MINKNNEHTNKVRMIMVGIITSVVAVITTIPMSAYAHSDRNNNGSYQYSNSAEDMAQSYSYKYNNGWMAGQYQAQSDYGAGNEYPNQQCPEHHTRAYCDGYWNGYGDLWNRSIAANHVQIMYKPHRH